MSGLVFREAQHLLIRLADESGIEGWGEASVFPTWSGDFGRYYGESARGDKVLFDELLAPALVGQRFETAGQLHTALNTALAGYPYLKSAIDIAWHDLKCKELGVPLYAYLGGKQREGVRVCQSIGFMTPEEAAPLAESGVREGASAIKVKVGRQLEADLATIEAVRAAVGPDFPIGVDGNRGYQDEEVAKRALTEFNRLGLTFFEQPVEGFERTARLRELGVPLILDESVWNERDLEIAVAKQAGDAIAVYLGKAGGIAQALALGEKAHYHGYGCSISGSGELGIANAANVHLGTVLPRLDFHAVIPISAPKGREPTQVVGRQYEDDIITQSFNWSPPEIRPSDKPGLGIEVDLTKLEAYRIV